MECSAYRHECYLYCLIVPQPHQIPWFDPRPIQRSNLARDHWSLDSASRSRSPQSLVDRRLSSRYLLCWPWRQCTKRNPRNWPSACWHRSLPPQRAQQDYIARWHESYRCGCAQRGGFSLLLHISLPLAI